MALSSQFENFRDTLYNETRQMLEVLDLCEDDMGVVHIEQVQAWLLITHYEFARANYRRAWVSAGRTFRLVQLAKLHEVDSPENILGNEDPILLEEKRRTFWVAYCLDRFICMESRWPLTLIEEVVRAISPIYHTDQANVLCRFALAFHPQSWHSRAVILYNFASSPKRLRQTTTLCSHP